MTPTPARAEFLGTAALVMAVVGSGVMAERLCGDNVGLALLANAIATGGTLHALILALGPVSGAHFNPVVTAFSAWEGALPRSEVPARVLAQLVGGALGTVLANLMFDLPAVTLSTHARGGAGVWLSEAVATLGLLAVIRGVARAAPASVPLAVAGWIVGAYWFTSSTSFANPAVTLARMLTDTFAGIAPASAPGFVAAQASGFLLACGLLGRPARPPPTETA